MKNIRLAVFSLVALVQLAVPAGTILRWQFTLTHGTPFKFLTAPVDPYDAFRGRYVSLRLEAEVVDVPEGAAFRPGSVVYGTVAVGTNGFAYLTDLSTEQPEAPSIRGRIRYVSGTKAYLHLPVDRLYMNERLAPEAERAYAQNSARTGQTAYVIVRVRHGEAVIEDLYINDTPIRDYLARPPDLPRDTLEVP